MRVAVDLDLCEGNARCVENAPEVFELREDQARLLIEHPDERLRSKVEQAVRLCPRQAISIREDE